MFEIIKKFLLLNDNNLTNPEDKLYKLRPFLSKISYLWKKHYSLGKTICIDEKMIFWHGITKWKLYFSDEPTKFVSKRSYCVTHLQIIFTISIFTKEKKLSQGSTVVRKSFLTINFRERI